MKRRTTTAILVLSLSWAAPVWGQDAHVEEALEDSVWTALEARINALGVAEVQASPLNPSRPKMKPSEALQATALDQIPATSRIEALTALPGVDMVSNGAGTLRPVIRGLSGLRVDLYLAPVGLDGEGARLVGQAVTGADGVYRAHVGLPRDLELGDYEICAATPGDGSYAPALSPR